MELRRVCCKTIKFYSSYIWELLYLRNYLKYQTIQVSILNYFTLLNHKLSVITQSRSISISFSLYIHLSDWIIWKWDQKFKLSSLFWRWHHNHQQRTNFRFRDIRKPIKCTFYDLGTLIYTRQFWVLQVFLFFFLFDIIDFLSATFSFWDLDY